MFPFHHPSLQFHHPRSSTLVLQAFWIFCSHFSLKKKPLLLFHTTSDQKIQNWFSTNYKIHPFSIMSLSWFTSISHVVWKLLKMSHFIFCILFKLICLVTLFAIKLRLFKNCWLFWLFKWIFVHWKCKRSSLRSQWWMSLFMWFSNTVSLAKLR